jgi:hypothetical protein
MELFNNHRLFWVFKTQFTILFANPGRYRYRWEDNIKNHLKERGCRLDEAGSE